VKTRLSLSAVAVLIGLAGLAGGVADAEPATPTPVPGSTSDDLADMVMDALGHGAAPTTTPVPPPPP
jgi:hypothetical protein